MDQDEFRAMYDQREVEKVFSKGRTQRLSLEEQGSLGPEMLKKLETCKIRTGVCKSMDWSLIRAAQMKTLKLPNPLLPVGKRKLIVIKN